MLLNVYALGMHVFRYVHMHWQRSPQSMAPHDACVLGGDACVLPWAGAAPGSTKGPCAGRMLSRAV